VSPFGPTTFQAIAVSNLVLHFAGSSTRRIVPTALSLHALITLVEVPTAPVAYATPVALASTTPTTRPIRPILRTVFLIIDPRSRVVDFEKQDRTVRLRLA
jgi:hypothetical protein